MGLFLRHKEAEDAWEILYLEAGAAEELAIDADMEAAVALDHGGAPTAVVDDVAQFLGIEVLAASVVANAASEAEEGNGCEFGDLDEAVVVHRAWGTFVTATDIAAVGQRGQQKVALVPQLAVDNDATRGAATREEALHDGSGIGHAATYQGFTSHIGHLAAHLGLKTNMEGIEAVALAVVIGHPHHVHFGGGRFR